MLKTALSYLKTGLIGAGIVFSSVLSAQDLLESYHFAAANAPVLKRVAVDVEVKRSIVAQARSLDRPKISMGGRYVWNRQQTLNSKSTFFSTGTDYFSTASVSLNVSQSLYQPNNRVNLAVAEKGTAKSSLQKEAAQQSLMYDVAQRYFSILLAQDTLALNDAEEKATLAQLEFSQEGFDLGLTAITDKHEAQARYDMTVANKIQANNALADALGALQELTDSNAASIERLQDDKAPLKERLARSLADWEQQALQGNLTLKSSRLSIKQAQLAVQSKRNGHLPVLSLTASQQYNQSSGGSFGGRSNTDTSLGLEFQMPLYQSGLVTAQVDEASRRKIQATYDYQQQQRAVLRQIREGFRHWQSSQATMTALQRVIQSSDTALSAAKMGLKLGTRTVLDVLNAQQTRFRAQRDYAQSRYDYLLSGLQLKRISGQLNETDLKQINHLLQKTS